jgi:hypothetical protein
VQWRQSVTIIRDHSSGSHLATYDLIDAPEQDRSDPAVYGFQAAGGKHLA